MRLVLNLCEWQLVRMISAVALSLGAVLFFVVTVGLVLLPADVERLRQPLYLSVIECRVQPQSERTLSLLWYMPRLDTKGWVHQLAWHDLRGERPQVEFAWPALEPTCTGRGAAPGELFVGCWDGTLWRVDLSQPKELPRRLPARLEMAPHVLSCSADGRWLAALGPQTLEVIDLSTGQTAWMIGGGQVRTVAMHPREPRLVVARHTGEYAELEAATGANVRILASFEEPGIQLAFSPTGDRLAIVASGGRHHLLDWSTGRSAWPDGWIGPYSRSSIVQFSPSGDRLITGGESVDSLAVWNLRTMRMERELHGHEKAINGVSFLDEQSLCSFGADGTIRIWNLDSDAPPRVLTIDVTAQAS